MKNPTFFFFWGGGLMKNQYRGENCLKRGGLGQFCQFRGAWQEREGVVLRGGGLMHTMIYQDYIYHFKFYA